MTAETKLDAAERVKPHFFVAPPSYRKIEIHRVRPNTRCTKCRVRQKDHSRVSAPLLDDDDCGGRHG